MQFFREMALTFSSLRVRAHILLLLHLSLFTSGLNSISTKKDFVAKSNAKFSVPFIEARPKTQSPTEQFWSLWNDKRSVADLIRDSRIDENAVPYCVMSEKFEVQGFRFQILLYPRGVFSSSSEDINSQAGKFPASAYLKFLPSEYGDEVDICWKLRLKDGQTGDLLPIETSGGLPKSNETWSAAMTFCTQNEAVDSVGRTMDWGSSIWNAQQVCDCLPNIEAEGVITIFDSRTGCSSLSLKGALGDSLKAATYPSGRGRIFRAGEIIVSVPDDLAEKQKLQDMGVYPGIDYRVMTLSDKDGNEIFTTESLSGEDRDMARLALRPVGWKLQQKLWETRGLKDWPIEVDAGLISPTVYSRFNRQASLSRFAAFLANDIKAVVFALAIAFAPIPAALVGRELISFYAIPSASMEPTLQKGDVLLVEKFPNIFSRTHRGDIVLFRSPTALDAIIESTGGSVDENQIFVKRLVGMPGDQNIIMKEDTQEVTVDGKLAVGPPRNLCDDEPLRLIDKLLASGKGKSLELLEAEDAYVLGDCKDVSVDSRVFGKLPKKNIVGKPIARVWPLERFKLGSP
mmetsp:Transcript_33282/g.50199  ORF Transcript_33282/g.50199 Transcript_33282/m.50199 type:complete len:572 (+) Transcript_33282:163-1878(+)